MGEAYRRNVKNLYGRPDIIGRDVWEVGGSFGQAPVGATSLTDRFSEDTYLAGAAMRLEGAMIQATGTLGAGRIGVEIKNGASVVGSGNLYASGPQSKYISFPKEDGLDVPVASGDALTVNYSVEQGLSAGNALRVSLGLCILEHPDGTLSG